jgi:hypothetical protein
MDILVGLEINKYNYVTVDRDDLPAEKTQFRVSRTVSE